MNCINANKELGFDVFSKCNYNLHWSFSNFYRMLMVAGQIAQLPKYSKVLELGAGSSDLKNIVYNNFKREDIVFIKVDGDEQYKDSDDITVCDITSETFDQFCKMNGPYDAIVFMEVIEHISRKLARTMIGRISSWLVKEGMLLFTTPTPPYEKRYESKVWPTDHDYEFSRFEIYSTINRFFKVNKEIGWSLEEREYNKLLESNANLSLIASKLRGAFPESYIRATIACLAPVEANRQVLMICKKRREAND